MKRNVLFVLAAIVVCGLTMTLFTQCNKDKPEENNPEVKMMYMVSVSPDVLTVADIEVNYVDASGAKQKEIMTDTVWKKPFTANTLPLTEGIWAKLTPKTILAEGTYQLGIQTAASYRATLPDGSQIDEAYGNDYESTVATAQSADEVAAWCAKSPTVAITLNEAGNAQLTTVDFGGNDAGSNGGGVVLCELFCWIWDLDPAVYCAK